MSRGEPQRSKVGRLVAIGKETFTNEQMVQQKKFDPASEGRAGAQAKPQQKRSMLIGKYLAACEGKAKKDITTESEDANRGTARTFRKPPQKPRLA